MFSVPQIPNHYQITLLETLFFNRFQKIPGLIPWGYSIPDLGDTLGALTNPSVIGTPLRTSTRDLTH